MKFFAWLEKIATVREIVWLVVIGWVITFSLGAIEVLFLSQPPTQLPPLQEGDGKYLVILMTIKMVGTPFLVAFEEVVGRVIPTLLFVLLLGRRKLTVVPLIAASTVFFIFLETSVGKDFLSVLIVQGVLGAILQILYLKAGAWHGRAWRGFLAVVALHTLHNWSCAIAGGINVFLHLPR